jgi:hypothetical protein
MKNKINKKTISITLLILLLSSILAFSFPLQRMLAEKTYQVYAAEQGVSADDIESKKFLKDLKFGGYIIMVTYKSDPINRYEYHYLPSYNKQTHKFDNKMNCEIYDNHNCLVEDFSNCPYKPLTDCCKFSVIDISKR